MSAEIRLNFNPIDAFIASLRPSGDVVSEELSNPDIVPILVVAFEFDGEYTGFYHEEIDSWEILDSNDEYDVVTVGNPYYDMANRTLNKFRDKLLAGPNGTRFQRLLTKNILQEIDAEILKDLRFASGLTSAPVVEVPTQKVEIVRLKQPKFRTVWSLDKAQDLNAAFRSDTHFDRSRIKFQPGYQPPEAN